MVLVAGTMIFPLAACDFTANGTLECRTEPNGSIVCSAEGTGIPNTPAPPSTTVPPTTRPPVTPPPTTEPQAPPTTEPPGSTPPPPDAAPTTTTRPPTTTVAPPITGEPVPGALTAAQRLGLGTPTLRDEFSYIGAPNPSLWTTPLRWGADGCGPGHAGNGRRCDSASRVDGTKLVMTGSPNGDTGWLKLNREAKYGVYEARVRSYNVGTAGSQYHPLLLLWPTSGKRVQDGEYDFMENGAPGEQCIKAFMHYPGETPKKQDSFQDCNVPGGLDEFHNVALAWTSTGLTGYIDGRQWFHTNNADIAAMPSGHLNIQLDNFYGAGMRESRLEVDWVRYYAV